MQKTTARHTEDSDKEQANEETRTRLFYSKIEEFNNKAAYSRKLWRMMSAHEMLIELIESRHERPVQNSWVKLREY